MNEIEFVKVPTHVSPRTVVDWIELHQQRNGRKRSLTSTIRTEEEFVATMQCWSLHDDEYTQDRADDCERVYLVSDKQQMINWENTGRPKLLMKPDARCVANRMRANQQRAVDSI